MGGVHGETCSAGWLCKCIRAPHRPREMVICEVENEVDKKEVFVDAVEVHDLVDCIEALTRVEL